MRSLETHGRKYATAGFLLAVLASLVAGQERYESGPHKGFLKENPPLNMVEIPTPFKVRSVAGVIVQGTGSLETPIAGATFEIRDSSAKVLSATTNDKGRFMIPNVPPGVYDFKATRNEFQSTVGRVIVSGMAPPNKTIRIELEIGS